MTIKQKLLLNSLVTAALILALSLAATHIQSQSLILILGGASALVSLLSSALVGRSVAGRITRLLTNFKAAEQGDFSTRFEAKGSDDLDRLGQGFNHLMEVTSGLFNTARQRENEAISETLRAREALNRAESARKKAEASRSEGMLNASKTLEKVLNAIRTASDRLGQEASAVNAGADRQKSLITDTAASMEEMNATVAEVARIAQQGSTLAGDTRRKAGSGAEVVRRAIAAISDVNTQTEALKANLAGLGSKAEAIGAVMNVISDIADQTNLLALNAAIEAARAGEAGRGFAVVADEVRKLAEKTMTATKEVGEAIASIQSGTRENIRGMEAAARAVAEATSLAGDSGQALDEIVTLATTTSEQIEHIATAAGQQASASEEINAVINDVNAISGETNEGMGRAVQAIDAVHGQLDSLSDLNRVFKLLGEGKVQALIMDLARNPAVVAGDRAQREAHLRKIIAANPEVELLYMTDAKGIQPIENIPNPNINFTSSGTTVGRDWSSRPWFQGAMNSADIYISESYVSSASGESCITVSSPIWDTRNVIVGIIAADVRLK